MTFWHVINYFWFNCCNKKKKLAKLLPVRHFESGHFPSAASGPSAPLGFPRLKADESRERAAVGPKVAAGAPPGSGVCGPGSESDYPLLHLTKLVKILYD